MKPNVEIERLGVDYQLVTDQTSLLLLTDEAFTALAIDPHNQMRTAREAEARDVRRGAKPAGHAVAVDRGFTGTPAGNQTSTSPSRDHGGYGGGALGPLDAGSALLMALGSLLSRRLRRRRD